ncbi:type VI secretion system Vgr family protein [Duganella callida]|uniref:Type VI secretion system tip protein VgrG n=1 Tax=Duganella callida TaxID=2561932 RepID=A0A4Y9SQF9_9BURK|nr:type VI secretion system Vgr family protein [Duganella callida]TFW28821.1 type VI secretion system tip protein VgrG [Duganella callida]
MSALLNGLTQDTRLLQLSTPLGADALVAECLRGEEAISRPYRLTVSALSPDAGIALKSLLGQPVLLQLQTTGAMRPFHGHVTAARQVGADGGLARYELTIGPWYAFLAAGRDSRVFQDKNVFDILDAIFNGWQDVGRLAPAWRYDVADRSLYTVRSLTCQYQESNLAFAERLMHEEGLFYYFEHVGDPDSPAFGSHTLVIADSNDSFRPNAQAQVRFTQPGAVMAEDSMDRWRTELRWTAGGVSLDSWDYRSLNTRSVSAASPTAAADAPLSRDTPGAYAYTSREHGQRVADRQAQALEAGREVHTGAGTVRTLSPGTTFTLNGQAQLDAGDEAGRNLVLLRVVHMAHNNLSADTRSAIDKALGVGALAQAIDEEQQGSLHAVGAGKGERPLYRNRIDAIRSDIPYRSSNEDGHGLLLHPRPTAQGQQTAIVVGPAGAVIHTDRDHRIKVQFHWQRGEQSHSRLNHPNDGHSGAPGDDSAGTWVRIATAMAPVAGANWGAVAVPRVGSEVLIDFIDGNIDRPVVLGSVYNGKGQDDAQHNQVAQGAGAATGNAPAWFPGTAAAHAHAAVLSGLKSQTMASSQSGSGAYSQLVFDDSPGEPRLALQRHAGPHRGTDELNLGHLRHQTDNQRLATAGFGAELKTEHSAAVRAGRGLLLSADARNGGAGAHLDSREAQAQIEASHELQLSLADSAQKQNAVLKGGKAGTTPEQLPAIADLAASGKVAGSTQAGADGKAQAAAYSAAQLQLSAPAGIAAVTPASAVLRAGGSTSLTAGQDLNFLAQGNSLHTVKDGISLFSYGKAGSADKPNQETGIKLHAASGKLSAQSQSGPTGLTADKLITVASVGKGVTVAGKQHVMLTAQGAYLKLEGGNIMVHGPGTMAFKASMKELTGPADGSAGKPVLPQAKDLYNEAFVVRDEKTGELMANVRYRMESASGQVLEGVTDAEGRTQRLFTGKAEPIKLFLPDHD